MMTDQVVGHFSEQASNYEILMERLVPWYQKQQSIINELLPEDNEANIHVLDLGCGSGALSELVLKRYPWSSVVGVDVTPNMLKAYEERLGQSSGRYELILGDYRFEPLGSNYDIILAGLTLHHLTWGERRDFYKLLYNALNPNGMFISSDIIIDEDWNTREKQYGAWKNFMESNGENAEFWYNKHMEKDFPITLSDHFNWLSKAGFKHTSCHWRHNNFAITSAQK
jgi:tRNA (cmo5U34)-methyltransferase